MSEKIKVNDQYDDGYVAEFEKNGPDSFELSLFLQGRYVGGVCLSKQEAEKFAAGMANLTVTDNA